MSKNINIQSELFTEVNSELAVFINALICKLEYEQYQSDALNRKSISQLSGYPPCQLEKSTNCWMIKQGIKNSHNKIEIFSWKLSNRILPILSSRVSSIQQSNHHKIDTMRRWLCLCSIIGQVLDRLQKDRIQLLYAVHTYQRLLWKCKDNIGK
jgi:hypothetical protein